MTPGWIGPMAGSVGPLGATLLLGLVTLRGLLPRGLPAALTGGMLAGLLGGSLVGWLAQALSRGRPPWLALHGEGVAIGEFHGIGRGIPEMPGVGELLSVGSILAYALALGAALRSWRTPLFELTTLVLLLPGLAVQLLVVIDVVSAPPRPVIHFLPPADIMLDLRSWAGGVRRPGFGMGAAVWGLHMAGFLGLAAWGRRRRAIPEAFQKAAKKAVEEAEGPPRRGLACPGQGGVPPSSGK